MWRTTIFFKPLNTHFSNTFFVKVPSNIVKCTTLQHLSLSYCDLTPLSGLQGFVNLISLKLKEVTITHNLLQAILHKSPLLQELYLKLDCYRNKDCPAPVIIDACLLKTFYLEADEYTELWRLRLRGKCSNLTVAFVHSDLEISTELPGNDKLNQFFNLLPNIEMLTLTDMALITLAEGIAPARFVRRNACLQNLKQLDIHQFKLRKLDCVACALWIIRSSPNLKSLTLSTSLNFDSTAEEEYEIFYKNQGSMEISSSLSKFDMDIRGDDRELLLVKTMLKCCPASETVRLLIDPSWIDSDEELSVRETMLGCPRPESAVIKFPLAWVNDNKYMFNRRKGGTTGCLTRCIDLFPFAFVQFYS